MKTRKNDLSLQLARRFLPKKHRRQITHSTVKCLILSQSNDPIDAYLRFAKSKEVSKTRTTKRTEDQAVASKVKIVAIHS